MKKYMVSISLLILLFGRVQGLTVIVSANPDTICSGATTQLEASVIGGSLPYTYSWVSNPPGFSSGSAIPTASPTFTTWYILTVTDNAANVAKDSVLVTVLNVPDPVAEISGPSEVCKDSVEVYSIVEVAGATSYLWTLPAGAMIVEGLNNSVVNIKWGATSGQLSVAGVNGCGSGTTGNMNVAIFLPPPVPGAITGPSELCKYQTADFSVANVFGASSYHWTVPPDADILNGQGFRSVKVHWGETAGTISVACGNFCGIGGASSKTITLGALPGAAGVITGKSDPCRGQNGYQYSVEEITGATSYLWTVPEGATISGIPDGKEIAVDFSLEAISGDITVKGGSACGTGAASNKPLILNDCSAIPENGKTKQVFFYPNPANDFVNLSFNKSYPQISLMISDIKGSIIFEETVLNAIPGMVKKIDVSAFEKGVYLLKLQSNDQVSIEKLIVQ